MVAKIIAHGDSREQARQRLVRALEQTALIGTRNNLSFLSDALQHPVFAAGAATTAFIGEAYEKGYISTPPGPEHYAAAAVLQYRMAQQRAVSEALDVSSELLGWSSADDLESVVRYDIDGDSETLLVRLVGKDVFTVTWGANRIQISVLALAENDARLVINERGTSLIFQEDDQRTLSLSIPGVRAFSVTDTSNGETSEGESASSGTVLAPMHGALVAVEVSVGDEVSKGDSLAVLEAMKMQHEITASISGKVSLVAAAAGDQLAVDDLILEIDPA